MHRLRKLLREIHRRTLWQILGIYLGFSWGVLHAVDFLTGYAGLPEWTATFAFVLLLLGLPVVTATAFVQQGIPGFRGEYRDEVDPNELVGLTPEEVHVDPKAHPLYRYRLLTWNNAVLGGVGAAALLVASVAAYFGMWAAGIGPMGSLVAQGLISPGDAVVLASFEDDADDGFGEAVSEALRMGLEGARVLDVVDGDQSGAAPSGPGTPMEGEQALHMARREGLKTVLDGSVTLEGAGYLITAVLREAESGRTLASFHSRAEGLDGMIPAIGRLSRDIREKSGESLLHIRASPPLSEAATASFDALRLYAVSGRARSRGDVPRAIGHLESALALDPDFALATLHLGNLYEQVGDTTRALEAHRRVVEQGTEGRGRGRRLVEAAKARIDALGG